MERGVPRTSRCPPRTVRCRHCVVRRVAPFRVTPQSPLAWVALHTDSRRFGANRRRLAHGLREGPTGRHVIAQGASPGSGVPHSIEPCRDEMRPRICGGPPFGWGSPGSQSLGGSTACSGAIGITPCLLHRLMIHRAGPLPVFTLAPAIPARSPGLHRDSRPGIGRLRTPRPPAPRRT